MRVMLRPFDSFQSESLEMKGMVQRRLSPCRERSTYRSQVNLRPNPKQISRAQDFYFTHSFTEEILEMPFVYRHKVVRICFNRSEKNRLIFLWKHDAIRNNRTRRSIDEFEFSEQRIKIRNSFRTDFAQIPMCFFTSIRRTDQSNAFMCPETFQGRIDFVSCRKQDTRIKENPLHGLFLPPLHVIDFFRVKSHSSDFVTSICVRQFIHCTSQKKFCYPLRAVLFYRDDRSRANKDPVIPFFSDDVAPLGDPETFSQPRRKNNGSPFPDFARFSSAHDESSPGECLDARHSGTSRAIYNQPTLESSNDKKPRYAKQGEIINE